MSHAKISVTIPEDILNDIKAIASKREIKLSRVVTEALTEKVKQTKQDAFIAQVNKIFKDPDIVKEQHDMAEDIAANTNIKELPW